ncbi:MAG TPA: methyltransferase domain-containing protein [Phycisphaerae bacterium]|nr:methyltransferase domain-containing protein [Phycisphaerae bacterium]HNU45674.1 methyltransferase domain-containing protein [Phycisphaerae bacterium]
MDLQDRSVPGPLFEVVDGQERYRGLPVVRTSIALGGHTFQLAVLEDAADLLDHPDYARRFLEDNMAPYGVELWPSAVMLAGHVLAGEPGAGRSALELGCGLGLVAMAATLHGWRVLATDHEETALQFGRYHSELNGIAVAGWERLDWRQPPGGQRFDRIFAADVLYEGVNHAPILQCIAALLAPSGEALIADPRRGVADRFEMLAVEHGFAVEVVPACAAGPNGKDVQGRIFVLRPAGGPGHLGGPGPLDLGD